jgi:hypothetical protein
MASTKLKTPTAVYAVVGAGDLVVERIRAVQVDREVEQLQAQVLTLPTKAQAAAAERLSSVMSDVRALPVQVRALPVQAQARVQAGVAAALGQASETYGDLAKRGEGLLTRIRRQKSTQETIDAAANTTSRAKATATTAKKAATSTSTTAQKAARTTRVTAEKAAKSTATSAKATRTTAQKAATSAAKATGDAAKKIGD